MREAVHFISFKHLGSKLTELLLDEVNVPCVNYFSLKDMRADLAHIDELANRWYE